MSGPDELFKTKCPECGANFLVPIEREGKKGRCPKCRAVFEVRPKKTHTKRSRRSPRAARAPASAERLVMWFGIIAIISIVGYFAYTTWAKKAFERSQAQLETEVERILARADDQITDDDYPAAKRSLILAQSKLANLEKGRARLLDIVNSRSRLERIRELALFEGEWIPKQQLDAILAERQEAARLRDLRVAERQFLDSVAGIEASVEGGAWLKRPDGGSEVLRGVPIELYRRNIDAERSATAKLTVEGGEEPATVIAAVASQADSATGAHAVRLLITRLTDALAGSAAAATETDIDGKYRFPDVAGGKYYLLARLEGTTRCVCWFVPLEITSAEARQVNFTDSNVMAMASVSPEPVLPVFPPPSEGPPPPEIAPEEDVPPDRDDAPLDADAEEPITLDFGIPFP